MIVPSDPIQEAINTLLAQKIGLEPDSIGSNTIARAVESRRLACGLLDTATYWKKLQLSPEEQEALVELVIVPETWFFRNPEAFDFLGHYIKTEWLSKASRSGLRVLSLPCSTGEEPYSIAMTLLEAGLTGEQFSIDAVDISKKSIDKAVQAFYSNHSFRGENLKFQSVYFTPKANGYQLYPWITQTVNFFQNNFLDPTFEFNKTSYHVIFCRNLLIYLNPSARQRAIEILEGLLVDSGLLFLGYAETWQVINSSRFVSVRHPSAFACQKVESCQPLKMPSKPKNQHPKTENSASPFPIRVDQNAQSPQSQLQTSTAKSLPVSEYDWVKYPLIAATHQTSESLLPIARSLADRGQFSEATQFCEIYLSQHGTCAEAYVLLGEIHQATGNNQQAAVNFQKAIYLQPHHYEALMHLALLKENQGDLAESMLLWQRIQRLHKI